MEKQHLVLWRGPCSTRRQRYLALTWLQGLDYCPLIGHNPGLLLACKKCGTEEETSVHILCVRPYIYVYILAQHAIMASKETSCQVIIKTDGQTDRHDAAYSRFSQFANPPTNP